MGEPTGIQPWDDKAMTESLLALITDLPRVRLDRLNAPAAPGVYLQFLAAEHLPILGVVAEGRYPAYVGLAARSLRERLGRYRQKLRDVNALSETNVYVMTVRCSSTASAAFGEACLIDALTPLLQGWGYGARKPQGAQRAGQRCSNFQRLLPDRRGLAPAPSLIENASAQLDVVSYLARLDPSGPRWPPLTRERPGAGRVMRLQTAGHYDARAVREV